MKFSLLAQHIGSFWTIFLFISTTALIVSIILIIFKKRKAEERSKEAGVEHPAGHHKHLPHYSK